MEQNKHYLRDSVLLLKLVFLFRVVILLDISVTNSMYIIHIQHSLRRLLEEQLSNKDCFNIIAYAQKKPVPSSQGRGCPGCSLETSGTLSPPPEYLPGGEERQEALSSLS